MNIVEPWDQDHPFKYYDHYCGSIYTPNSGWSLCRISKDSLVDFYYEDIRIWIPCSLSNGHSLINHIQNHKLWNQGYFRQLSKKEAMLRMI